MSKNKTSEVNNDILETKNMDDEERAVEYFDDNAEVSQNIVQIDSIGGAVASLYDWLKYMLFAISIVIICLTFVFRLVNVEGSSMDNTLSSGDKVIVTNFMYEPQDGDIVVISHGAEYVKPIIKRVIATEGQSIKLDYENDRIIVDGIEINEPYLDQSTFGGNIGDNKIPDVIPEGKIFVMGDNREVSLDSRSTKIGLIDVDNVIGKAQFVALPFSDIGYLY